MEDQLAGISWERPSSEFPQERGERFEREVAGVGGGWRQASNFADEVFPAHLARFVYVLASDQLGDG